MRIGRLIAAAYLLAEAPAIALVLVTYPGAAVVNVISVRGIWRACRRRRLRGPC
jgi:hypothetical protein